MSDHEFLFALELSDESHFETMLFDVATAVLGHVGYHAGAIEEVRAALRQALASDAAKGARRCDVKFRARSGELELVVTYAGGAEWRTTRALP